MFGGKILRRRAGNCAAAALGACLLLAFSPRLHAQVLQSSCADLSSLKSPSSSYPVTLQFVNDTSGLISVYWIDFNGFQEFYMALAPGASFYQPTFSSHIWLVTDSAGQCLGVYIAGTTSATVTITGQSIQSQSTLTVSPAQVSFNGTQDGAPSQATLQLRGTAGQAFTVSTGSTWLKASPSSGTLPAAVQLTADPAGLSAITYNTTVTVSAPGATPASVQVGVTFAVTAPSGPALGVTPSSLGFYLQQGSAASTQLLTVTSNNGTLPISITSMIATGGQWLTVSPSSGTATPANPLTVTVTSDPSSLMPGSYAAAIMVSEGSERSIIPVALTVSSTGPRISLSQTGLTFQAVSGISAIPPQNVLLANAGAAVLNYVTEVTTSSGGSWLTVTPPSGSIAENAAPVNLQVVVNPSGLAAGKYYGRITVHEEGASGPFQTMMIVMRIAPPATDLDNVIRPGALVFVAPQGGANPASQTFTVYNISTNSVGVSLLADVGGGTSFVTAAAPSTGTATPASPLTVSVTASQGTLTAGIYQESLLLQFSDGGSARLPVVLVVTPVAAAASKVKAAAGCSPTKLLPVFTELGQNFTVPAGWPATIDLLVVDDCGGLLNTGTAVASFSNGDPPLSLTPQQDGHWSGTWTGTHASTSVTVTAAVRSVDGALSGSASIGGNLQTNQGFPIVFPGGVVSSAAFAGGQPTGPGSLVAVFGSGLSDAFDVAKSLPLPQLLQGTQVVLGSRILPIYFTSDGQLAVSVPYDIPVNTQLPLVVTHGNAISVPQPVTLAAAQPAIFAVNSMGSGQGHVYAARPDGSVTLATPTDPAHIGSVVVMICSGLGAVAPPIADGAGPTGRSDTVNPVTVTFGGVSTTALAAVALSGASDVYQVNAVVPDGVTLDDQVPVTVTVAGQTSPPVTMAVK
jgi:uncharacterized protein (TIGR03437 family)